MASARPTDNFDVDLFETRLEALKDTQEGIQQMSSWCLQQRVHHKKIVSCWLNVFKRVRVEHRLTLFYLANDVIQYSKRKRYEFVQSWATALQKATTMVRDDKVKNKILRIFNIWEQREIYSEEYLSDLCGLLNIAPPKSKNHQINVDSDDFQNSHLIATVRECVELSEKTDKSFKKLPRLPNWDTENIKQQLKDKTHSDDVENEIERYITYIEAFNKNLQTEIKSRKMVLNHLDNAIKFYANQRGEVKVVVSAYKNFGSRIKLVKKKLDEITPSLPSPIPSPDINAPSPEPDADLLLPDEQTPISMNFTRTNFNGYSSYLDGNLPFDINDFKREDNTLKSSSQPIEVIGSRKEEESSFNSSSEYYKSDTLSTYPSTSNMQIPGLSPVNVPSVPSSGYASLARTSQQYPDVLPPPPNPPLFGGLLQSHDSTYTSTYDNNNPYDTNTYNNNTNTNDNTAGNSGIGNTSGNSNSLIRPLLPPPPLPNLDGSEHGSGSSSSLNSSWDLNMSWTNSLDVSAPMDTPVSPPLFEREALNNNSATLEYNGHENNLTSAQDVDHRQLHLPAFGLNAKLTLSKEKSRQLDIDHRNLISLTGSPIANDADMNKKSWLTTGEDEFKTTTSGDVDYRSFGQNIKTIGTTTSVASTSKLPSNANASNVNEIKTQNQTKATSPSENNNKSPSTEVHKDDVGVNVCGGTSYDPTDMVIDMDMSDEDLDDIFREVVDQNNITMPLSSKQIEMQENHIQDDKSIENQQEQQSLITSTSVQSNIPLLETPGGDYGPPSAIWEESIQEENHHQHSHESLKMNANQTVEWQHQMTWNNNNTNNNNSNNNNDTNNNANIRGNLIPPPPPRSPYPHMSTYSYSDGSNYVGNRGGKVDNGSGNPNWAQPFAPNTFVRLPRGHSMGSPYYNRNNSLRGMGINGKIRGNIFRGSGGRFRGKNNWI